MLQVSLQGYGFTVGRNHGLTLGSARAPVLDIAVERLPKIHLGTGGQTLKLRTDISRESAS